MDKIQSLGSPSNQRADVYHVVVGTRAIQEVDKYELGFNGNPLGFASKPPVP